MGGGSLGVSVEQDACDPSASQTSVGEPLSQGSCYHADSADLGWELRLYFRQASRRCHAPSGDPTVGSKVSCLS